MEFLVLTISENRIIPCFLLNEKNYEKPDYRLSFLGGDSGLYRGKK